MVESAEQLQIILQELVRRANSHTQRLSAIDEKIKSLQLKIDSLEDAKSRLEKNLDKKIEKLAEQANNIKEELFKVNERISRLEEQSKKFAKKRELEELAEFLDIISPLKHEFVTWGELKRELDKIKEEFKIKYGRI